MSSDRADKSDLGDETPWGRGPRELAIAAKERERVLGQNAQEIRKLGKRASADVQREFGWTNRHALNYTRVYELSLKFENFSDLGIPASGLYLLAAPSTPPDAVDEVIECAKSGERQTHAEIKGKIEKIKRVKAAAAGIKPERGSSKKRTKAEGPVRRRDARFPARTSSSQPGSQDRQSSTGEGGQRRGGMT
jgi:hypothetical protein